MPTNAHTFDQEAIFDIKLISEILFYLNKRFMLGMVKVCSSLLLQHSFMSLFYPKVRLNQAHL